MRAPRDVSQKHKESQGAYVDDFLTMAFCDVALQEGLPLKSNRPASCTQANVA